MKSPRMVKKVWKRSQTTPRWLSLHLTPLSIRYWVPTKLSRKKRWNDTVLDFRNSKKREYSCSLTRIKIITVFIVSLLCARCWGYRWEQKSQSREANLIVGRHIQQENEKMRQFQKWKTHLIRRVTRKRYSFRWGARIRLFGKVTFQLSS